MDPYIKSNPSRPLYTSLALLGAGVIALGGAAIVLPRVLPHPQTVVVVTPAPQVNIEAPQNGQNAQNGQSANGQSAQGSYQGVGAPNVASTIATNGPIGGGPPAGGDSSNTNGDPNATNAANANNSGTMVSGGTMGGSNVPNGNGSMNGQTNGQTGNAQSSYGGSGLPVTFGGYGGATPNTTIGNHGTNNGVNGAYNSNNGSGTNALNNAGIGTKTGVSTLGSGAGGATTGSTANDANGAGGSSGNNNVNSNSTPMAPPNGGSTNNVVNGTTGGTGGTTNASSGTTANGSTSGNTGAGGSSSSTTGPDTSQLGYTYGAPPTSTSTAGPVTNGAAGSTAPVWGLSGGDGTTNATGAGGSGTTDFSGASGNGGVVNPRPAISASYLLSLSQGDDTESAWSSLTTYLKSGDMVLGRISGDASSSSVALANWSDRVHTDTPLVTYYLGVSDLGKLRAMVNKGLPASLDGIGPAQTDGVDLATAITLSSAVHGAGKRFFLSVSSSNAVGLSQLGARADVVELVIQSSDPTAAANEAFTGVTALRALGHPQVFMRLPSGAVSSSTAASTMVSTVQGKIPDVGFAFAPGSSTSILSDLRTSP